MCRWMTQPCKAVSIVLGWCVLMCFRCDSWPDKIIPIIEYKVCGLLFSAAQIELSATQTVWRCQGWHGLSPRLCALLFTRLWQIVHVCVSERERGRAESKMSCTKHYLLVSINILFCKRLNKGSWKWNAVSFSEMTSRHNLRTVWGVRTPSKEVFVGQS